MTRMHDAETITELLDRQFGLLSAAEGGRRIRLLPRVLGFLQTEPSLAGLVADLRFELAQSVEELTAADTQIRTRLAALWQQHGSAINEALPHDDDTRDVYARRAEYPERLAQRSPFAISTKLVADPPEHPTRRLILALKHWVVTIRQRSEKDTGEPAAGFDGVEGELERLQALHDHHVRRADDLRQLMPGAAFDRLLALSIRLNPEPPVDTGDVTTSLTNWAEFLDQVEFAERVYGRRPRENFVPLDEVDIASAALVEAATLLHEELRARVLVGRSREALVRRYAARCEAFDADRLRAIAADTKRAERHLTREFAQYLFDQGLTPIVDGTIANLRPDVIDVAAGSLFYVEAKQFAAASRSDVLGWFRQVWSTWGRLRNQYAVPEAFLIVFRRDGAGARLEFPRVVRGPSGLRLYPIFADLAEAAGSSEQSRAFTFDAEELGAGP